MLADEVDLETFFAQAPAMNPNASLITGVICGHRVEDIDDPLMQQIRYLDKLVDEVARARKMSAVLRGGDPAGATALNSLARHPCDRWMIRRSEATALRGREDEQMPGSRPEARCAGGTVRGVLADGVAVFRGIPFAEPPSVRSLRRTRGRRGHGTGSGTPLSYGPPPPQSGLFGMDALAAGRDGRRLADGQCVDRPDPARTCR